MKKIISILIENEPGALSRVAGLFSARAYNIHSLSVAPTNDEKISRMTIVTKSDDQKLEQIIKQINKLIEVFKVVILDDSALRRQLSLIKLWLEDEKVRQAIYQRILIFNVKVISVDSHTYVIELIGDDDYVDSFLQSIPQNAILDVLKTGLTGLSTGK